MAISAAAAATAVTGGIQLAQFIMRAIETAQAMGAPLSPEQQSALFSAASTTIASGKAAWKAGGETAAAKEIEVQPAKVGNVVDVPIVGQRLVPRA